MLRKIITQYNQELKLNPIIITGMGDVLSIQANRGAYCTPRINNGVYIRYELLLDGFLPNYLAPEVSELTDLNEYLFAYLDATTIEQYIKERGGIRTTCKSFQDAVSMAGKIRDEKFNHEMLVVAKRQARTLTNAPSLEQHRFICELPETVWREVLEIVLEGADPIIWERNRNNYKPDTISKMQANIDRKRKNRRAYAKNGRVGRSKKSLVLNGCTANLGVV